MNYFKWFLKLAVTVVLFILIFTELGEHYVPTTINDLKSKDLLFKRLKTSFWKKKPPLEKATLKEICSLDTKHIFYIKLKNNKLKPIDRDYHCFEGKIEKVFVKINNELQSKFIEDIPPDKTIYIKTKGWWRVAPISPKDLWLEIKTLNLSVFWFWILFAILVKTGGILASLTRWYILLKGQDIHLPFKYLLGTFFIGRFLGMFLPSTIGLDGYRLYDSIRQTKKPIECTAVIVVEKLIGFVALFSLVFLTLPLGTRILTIRKPYILFIILAILLAFILFVLLLLYYPKIPKTLIKIIPIPMKSKFENKINTIVKSTTIYADKKMLLTKAILLGFLVHIGTILMYFGTMRSIMTQGVNLLDILFTSPLMITGTVFGPTIGGEGVRELVFTYLLGPKAGAAKAFLLAHLGFWIGEFLLSLPGAVVYSIRPVGYKIKEIKQTIST